MAVILVLIVIIVREWLGSEVNQLISKMKFEDH